MPEYRRKKVEGGCYFFTVVTYKRRSFLTDVKCRSLLKASIKEVQTQKPFVSLAFCLMPDHLHCLWQLPPDDWDYSSRWSMIKRIFSKQFLAEGGKELPQPVSRQKKRESGIWQRRFWEHRIRDEKDYWRHVHYIHYNPVRHGLVERLELWPYSTYHDFCKAGLYDSISWDFMQSIDYGNGIEYEE